MVSTRLATLLLAASLLGCEAQTTVRTRLVLPGPLVASEAALSRLHLRVLEAGSFSTRLELPIRGRCPAFDPTTPEPRDQPRISVENGAFVLEQSDIPSVPELCVSAWFDANGNTQLDAGDAMGNLAAPYPSQPSTFFGSNHYESPAVQLELVK